MAPERPAGVAQQRPRVPQLAPEEPAEVALLAPERPAQLAPEEPAGVALQAPNRPAVGHVAPEEPAGVALQAPGGPVGVVSVTLVVVPEEVAQQAPPEGSAGVSLLGPEVASWKDVIGLDKQLKLSIHYPTPKQLQTPPLRDNLGYPTESGGIPER